jgi:hypothetical protein
MPKVTITFSGDELLKVLNRDLRIPGRVESVVDGIEMVGRESATALELVHGYVLLIDLEPIHDYGTAFTFSAFMREMFPKNDISEIEDPDDYAVLENMLAAVSTFDPFSFDWVG